MTYNLELKNGKTYTYIDDGIKKVPRLRGSRQRKNLLEQIVKNNDKIQTSFYHFVRELKQEYEPQFDKFNSLSRKKGLVNVCNLGKGQIVCISAIDTMNLIKNEIKHDPFFLVKGFENS